MITAQDLFIKGRDLIEDGSVRGNETLTRKAASYLRQAIDIAKPDAYPEAASYLSTCLLLLEDTKQAKLWAEEALRYVPYSLRSRSTIALSLWIESDAKLGQSNFLQRMNDGSMTGLAFGLVGIGVQVNHDTKIRNTIHKAFSVWGEILKYCVYNQTETTDKLLEQAEFMLDLPPSIYINHLLKAISTADWHLLSATPKEQEMIEDVVHRAAGQLSLSN